MPKTINEEQAEAYMNIMATLLDLRLDPAYQVGVIANLQVLLGHANIANGFNASSDLAPAPDFTP